VNKRFQAKRVKNSNFHIFEAPASTATKVWCLWLSCEFVVCFYFTNQRFCLFDNNRMQRETVAKPGFRGRVGTEGLGTEVPLQGSGAEHQWGSGGKASRSQICIYRVAPKNCTLYTLVHNFAKYWPIFI